MQALVLPTQHRHRFMTMHGLQVSTKLLDHLVARSTKAYKQGIQDSPTKKVILTNCHQVSGAGPPMAFVEHCLRRCPHLEVVEATGFGGVKGAFHMNDLLMLLRTLNKMRPAPEVQTSSSHYISLNWKLPAVCQCTHSAQSFVPVTCILGIQVVSGQP